MHSNNKVIRRIIKISEIPSRIVEIRVNNKVDKLIKPKVILKVQIPKYKVKTYILFRTLKKILKDLKMRFYLQEVLIKYHLMR